MGRMKDWKMDMDFEIESAIIGGVTDPDEVAAYVRTQLPITDYEYIRKQVTEILGPDF